MNCVIAGFLTVHCMVYIVEDTCAPLNQFFCPLCSVRSKLVDSSSMHMLLFSLLKHFIYNCTSCICICVNFYLSVCTLLAYCRTFGTNKDSNNNNKNNVSVKVMAWCFNLQISVKDLLMSLQNATVQGISGTGSLRVGAAFFVSLQNLIRFWLESDCDFIIRNIYKDLYWYL